MEKTTQLHTQTYRKNTQIKSNIVAKRIKEKKVLFLFYFIQYIN